MDPCHGLEPQPLSQNSGCGWIPTFQIRSHILQRERSWKPNFRETELTPDSTLPPQMYPRCPEPSWSLSSIVGKTQACGQDNRRSGHDPILQKCPWPSCSLHRSFSEGGRKQCIIIRRLCRGKRVKMLAASFGNFTQSLWKILDSAAFSLSDFPAVRFKHVHQELSLLAKA